MQECMLRSDALPVLPLRVVPQSDFIIALQIYSLHSIVSDGLLVSLWSSVS
jgi:hypothetical protein